METILVSGTKVMKLRIVGIVVYSERWKHVVIWERIGNLYCDSLFLGISLNGIFILPGWHFSLLN